MFRNDLLHVLTAINGDVGTGQERGFFTREIRDQTSDLFQFAKPRHRKGENPVAITRYMA